MSFQFFGMCCFHRFLSTFTFLSFRKVKAHAKDEKMKIAGKMCESFEGLYLAAVLRAWQVVAKDAQLRSSVSASVQQAVSKSIEECSSSSLMLVMQVWQKHCADQSCLKKMSERRSQDLSLAFMKEEELMMASVLHSWCTLSLSEKSLRSLDEASCKQARARDGKLKATDLMCESVEGLHLAGSQCLCRIIGPNFEDRVEDRVADRVKTGLQTGLKTGGCLLSPLPPR